MSYKRSHSIVTNKHLEYCTYVVREEEEALYRNAGIEELLVIPSSAKLKCGAGITSFSSTFRWIIENTPEDCIAILDDDIVRFAYRLDVYTAITKDNYKNHKEIVTSEIERLAQLIVDLDLGLLCDNPQYSPYGYLQEFTFKGMPGALRIVNKPCLKATFDPNDEATSDIDFVMQELFFNRIILQPRYFMAVAMKDTNDGGGYSDSNTKTRYRIAMKNKWKKYYDYDPRKNIAKINLKR